MKTKELTGKKLEEWYRKAVNEQREKELRLQRYFREEMLRNFVESHFGDEVPD